MIRCQYREDRGEVRCWIVELPDVLEIPRLVGSVVKGH